MQVSVWLLPATCLAWCFQMPLGQRSTASPVSCFWNKILPTIRAGRLSFRKMLSQEHWPHCHKASYDIDLQVWPLFLALSEKRRVKTKENKTPKQMALLAIVPEGCLETGGRELGRMVGNHAFWSTQCLCRCEGSTTGRSVDIVVLC